MPPMTGHNQRSRRNALRQARRSLRPAPSSCLVWRRLHLVTACAIAAVSIVLVLLLTSPGRNVASNASTKRVRLQRQVTALLAGIPQHGVILGQPTAPVTLQLFVDLEDNGDSTVWLDAMLPPILEKFVRTNIVRLEFHSFKTDTLNRRPFFLQQVAALAAGAQNLLWNYVAIFMNEQGREFTNYVNEEFVTGIAEQVSGLNLAKWEQSLTFAMAKTVEADIVKAHDVGFHDTPAFRIGLTGGKMKNFVGRHVEIPHHKYIVRTRPSGERYIVGESSAWQHPVSLIDAIDLKKAVEELI
jgi:protein-disulfide isomerase